MWVFESPRATPWPTCGIRTPRHRGRAEVQSECGLSCGYACAFQLVGLVPDIAAPVGAELGFWSPSDEGPSPRRPSGFFFFPRPQAFGECSLRGPRIEAFLKLLGHFPDQRVLAISVVGNRGSCLRLCRTQFPDRIDDAEESGRHPGREFPLAQVAAPTDGAQVPVQAREAVLLGVRGSPTRSLPSAGHPS